MLPPTGLKGHCPQSSGAGSQAWWSWLVTSSGWSPSYVHTSRGITPSLLLSGGNKDSSSRNLRGKWTRWPWMWVSSDRAKGGLTMARGSTATYSRSVRRERVALHGRQRKIWEVAGAEKPIRLGETLPRAQAQLSWKPTTPYQPGAPESHEMPPESHALSEYGCVVGLLSIPL